SPGLLTRGRYESARRARRPRQRPGLRPPRPSAPTGAHCPASLLPRVPGEPPAREGFGVGDDGRSPLCRTALPGLECPRVALPATACGSGVPRGDRRDPPEIGGQQSLPADRDSLLRSAARQLEPTWSPPRGSSAWTAAAAAALPEQA